MYSVVFFLESRTIDPVILRNFVPRMAIQHNKLHRFGWLLFFLLIMESSVLYVSFHFFSTKISTALTLRRPWGSEMIPIYPASFFLTLYPLPASPFSIYLSILNGWEIVGGTRATSTISITSEMPGKGSWTRRVRPEKGLRRGSRRMERRALCMG
jgi:hypothetical protein